MANQQQQNADQNRQWAYNRGQTLSDQAGEDFNNNATKVNNYSDASDAFNYQRMGGNAGYNQNDAANIYRDQDVHNAMTTDDELAGNYFSDAEGKAMQGNTSDWGKYFDANAATDQQTASGQKQDIATQGLQTNLNAAIDPRAMVMDPNYAANMQGAVGNTASAVHGDINKSDLEQSQEANQAQQLTPQQQQDIVTGAGISAGAGYRAQEDQLERAAAQAGINNPLGVAAAKARMEQQAAAAGGDAMTQARILASNTAAQRAQQAEQQRMQGASTYGGMSSAADIALGNQNINAQENVEATRLGAQQNLTKDQLEAATTGGQAGIKNAADQNAQGRDVSQFNTTTGTNLMKGEDEANVARATAMTQNRQNIAQGNEATKYNQGMGAAQTLSGQAKSIGDVNVAEKDKGAEAIANQGAMYNANAENAANRGVALYGTQGGLANQATQQGEVASQNPTIWDKILGAGVGAVGAYAGAGGAFEHGGIVDRPTIGLVGEKGPEIIIPLYHDPLSKTQAMVRETHRNPYAGWN